MITKENFTKPLLNWYDTHKRDLPWRKTKNPYHIWVSEIMLQQTRVEAVIGYYDRFLKTYPTIESLQQASTDELYKIWQGLGYYRRVINLQLGAKQIIEDYQGIFPTNKKEIQNIKGIGDYTSSAIASICFGEQVPAVDGNLLRIFARVFHYTENILEPKAKKICYDTLLPLVPTRAGDFNQALMDIGATICLPNSKPKCESCPFQSICQSKKEYQTIPFRKSKTIKKDFNYTIFILRQQEQILVIKRNQNDVLKDMDAFPQANGHLSIQEAIHYVENEYGKVKNIQQSFHEKHIFTHQIWNMLVYVFDITPKEQFRMGTIDQFAIPTAFKKCYKKAVLAEE